MKATVDCISSTTKRLAAQLLDCLGPEGSDVAAALRKGDYGYVVGLQSCADSPERYLATELLSDRKSVV